MKKVQKRGPKRITVLYPLPNTTGIEDKQVNKQRVAAYCRVSTASDEQISSYRAQIKYYEEYLGKNSEYEYIGIYADEGITGTSIQKRDAFVRMIQDARDGRIDMIITKSLSRFGRNTLDCLNSIRELKSLGVDVFFEKENIHTTKSEGEVLITLISAVAENESFMLSENVKWGKRRKFEKGDIGSVAFKNITGYERNQDGEVVINEEQAAIIRRVYKQFLDGYGIGKIVKQLNEEDVPLTNGGKEWTYHHIKNYLKNEKYMGSIKFQKRFILDPLSKKSIINKGHLPQYYCGNTHPAIIDRDTWECVQLELERQNRFCKEHFTDRYHFNQCETPLTGKIVCSHCGHLFKISLSNRLVDKGTRHYSCPKYSSGYLKPVKPGSCRNGERVPMDSSNTLFINAWNHLVDEYESYLPKWQQIIEDGDELQKYRVKELMRLVKETGYLEKLPYELMLKTLDYIEVGDGSMEVIFLGGVGVRVV